MKKHKLFASYLQQQPSKSIELAAAKQKQSNDIAKTQQTFQQSTKSKKCNFCWKVVDYVKILLCFCYVFALQQLILYFLMVFVANSLQIACISSFLQAICNKNHRKNKETQAICKLFATKTIKKYRISCCKAKTQQKHSKLSSKNQHFLEKCRLKHEMHAYVLRIKFYR